MTNKTNHKSKTSANYEAEARRQPNGCLIHPALRVSRRIYQMRHGSLPNRHVLVCHTCDNPYCIEDSHHWLGSQTDNMEDASTKKRLKGSRGKHWTTAAKKRASLARKGVPKSAEWRKNIGLAHQGKKFSDERKAQMSAARLGAKATTKAKRKMSESQTKRYQNPEECYKMHLASATSAEKMRGVPRSAEVRLKLRLANLGKKQSEETKEKNRQSQIKRWAKYRQERDKQL